MSARGRRLGSGIRQGNFLDLVREPISASDPGAWRRDGETRCVEVVLASFTVFEKALERVVD